MTDHTKALNIVRSSGLAALSKSPAHFKAWVEEPDQDTPAMQFGGAFHCYVLEPESFASRYAVQPVFGDLRTKVAKAERDAWLEEHQGHAPVSAEDMLAMKRMRDALFAYSLIARLLSDGFAEQSVSLTTEQHPTLVQIANPDYVRPTRGVVVDLKTTDDASERGMQRSISTYGYAIQNAHYSDVLREHGMQVHAFATVFVEKSPPYGVNVCLVDDDDLAWARQRRIELMDLQAECLERDTWPCYAPGLKVVKLLPWARL